MPSLAITNEEVYGNLGYFLGIGRDVDSWDAELTADVQRIIRSGKRKFFGAHNWQFLEQAHSIVTTAPQTTGTITAVDGVVTLSGATWPAAAVNDYVLVPATGGVYRIAVRTDTTNITLHDTSVDIDAGTAYTLYRVNYALPSTFGGWLDPVTLENNQVVREMGTLPEWEIRAVANHNQVRAGEPESFSVSQRISDTESGIPEWYLTTYPLPDAVYVLYSRIRIQPGDTLDMANDLPVAHPVFSECLLESILAAAEIHARDTKGVHNQRFNELLQDAIAKDRTLRGTRSVSQPDRVSRDPLYHLRNATVEYDTL